MGKKSLKKVRVSKKKSNDKVNLGISQLINSLKDISIDTGKKKKSDNADNADNANDADDADDMDEVNNIIDKLDKLSMKKTPLTKKIIKRLDQIKEKVNNINIEKIKLKKGLEATLEDIENRKILVDINNSSTSFEDLLHKINEFEQGKKMDIIIARGMYELEMEELNNKLTGIKF